MLYAIEDEAHGTSEEQRRAMRAERKRRRNPALLGGVICRNGKAEGGLGSG